MFTKRTIAALIFSSLAVAAQAGPTQEQPACTTSSWQITQAKPSAAAGALVNIPDIAATSCVGTFDGNISGGALNPKENLGYAGDGLMNGGGTLSGLQFITESQLQGIKNPANKVDPGWILLGEQAGDAGGFSYASVKTGANSSYSLSNVLKYTQTETTNGHGAWTLEVDKNIKSLLDAQGLFERSSFDHLAFAVKAGNDWAVYDFDFNLINAAAPGAFDLTKPYTLSGTWTTACDFCNGNNQPRDISHMLVFARDPITAEAVDVPEPAGVALVGLSLGLLALVSRKRAQRAA